MNLSGLDPIDKRILNLLQKDAKLTNKEIAAQLNMTTTPIYERIKRLEKAGFIKGYVALVDADKIGLPMIGFCNVSLKEHAVLFIQKFEAEVSAIDEVIECYHIAGMFDYLIKVVVPDMAAYQNFITNKLATLDNIGKVQSSFVMTKVKYATAITIE